MIYFVVDLIKFHVCICIRFQSRTFEQIYNSIGTLSKINKWVKKSILTYEIKISPLKYAHIIQKVFDLTIHITQYVILT